MSEYSSTTPSIGGPRSPLFGTATYYARATSQTQLSPSRHSSSTTSCRNPLANSSSMLKLHVLGSESRMSASYDSDDASIDRRMRRMNLSPVPSSRESDSYSYLEEDSNDERAEVEAALTQVEDEIETTLEAWSRNLTDRDRRVLSTISERTENISSRPTSYGQQAAGIRSSAQYLEDTGTANRRSAHAANIAPPSAHLRSTTEPAVRPNTPGRGVSEIIAQFEAKRAAGDGYSLFLQGHARTTSAPSGPRSPSPYATTIASQTMPTLSSLNRDAGYTYGYGASSGYSYSSRPSSPSKSRAGSVVSGPRPPPSFIDSRTTPVTHSRTQSEVSGYSAASSRVSDTFTGLTGSGSVTGTDSASVAPTAFSLRRPHSSPRSPITQVTNIVAAWKGKTPVLSKTSRRSLTPSPAQSDAGRRRRSFTRSASGKPRRVSDSASSDAGSIRSPGSGARNAQASASLPPPFDASEFGVVGEVST